MRTRAATPGGALFVLLFGLSAEPVSGCPLTASGFDIGQWDRFYDGCRLDAAHFCPEVAPTATRTAHCLFDRRDQLSAGCRQALANLSGGAARSALHAACASDQARWCAHADSMSEDLALCMREHIPVLSPECLNAADRLSLKTACLEDVATLCLRSTERDERLRACILRHSDDLSLACRLTIPDQGVLASSPPGASGKGCEGERMAPTDDAAGPRSPQPHSSKD